MCASVAGVTEIRRWVVHRERDRRRRRPRGVVRVHGVDRGWRDRVRRAPNAAVARPKGQAGRQGRVDAPGGHFTAGVARQHGGDGGALRVGVRSRRVGGDRSIEADFEVNLSAVGRARNVGPDRVGGVHGGHGRRAGDGARAAGQAHAGGQGRRDGARRAADADHSGVHAGAGIPRVAADDRDR